MVSSAAVNSLITKEDSVPRADGKGDEATSVVSATDLIQVRLQAYLRLSLFFLLAVKCHFRSPTNLEFNYQFFLFLQ